MRLFTAIIILSFLISACRPNGEVPQIQVDDTPYPLELPPGFPEPEFPEDNALTQARVALGKKLFYDPILSSDSSIACASCHKQALAFADSFSISPGVENRRGFRNAPTLANVAWLGLVNKDGGVVKLDLQASVPLGDENEMDLQGLFAGERLQQNETYREMSLRAYGREPSTYVITRALGAFLRTMVSGNSRFDQYQYQGKTGAFSDSELRGLALFNSARLQCGDCHSGFNFTNNRFENNGLKETYEDLGRMRVTSLPEDEEIFRVPTLRNVALTAPYMHDGSLPTLEAVIAHYNSGGSNHPNKSEKIRPLQLTEQEKTDLLHFLKALTDSTFIQNPVFRPD